MTDRCRLPVLPAEPLLALTCLFPVQTAILLLRIDDIVSGHKKKDKDGPTGGPGAE